MIPTNITGSDFGIKFNLGRPNLFTDADFAFWGAVHNYIKTTDVEIAVSPAFYTIERYIAEKQGFGGGGFQYCFWWKTVEDFNLFKDEFNRLVKEHGRGGPIR